MAQLEWSEQFSVHIDRMDEQHRQIFTLLNRFRELSAGDSDRAAAEALRQLAEYGDFHLRREELILRARNYPAYLEHRAEHDHYRARVEHLRERPLRMNQGVRVGNFLAEWWRQHILASDRKYAVFFQETSR